MWFNNRLSFVAASARRQLQHRSRRMKRRGAPGRCCPRLELLEDRLAPATITVTTAVDNGDNNNPLLGSLRQAILSSNGSVGVMDTIAFNIPGGGVDGWGVGRHFISKGGSLYSRMILGLNVRDLTSGYKAFSRRASSMMFSTAMNAPPSGSASKITSLDKLESTLKNELKVQPQWVVYVTGDQNLAWADALTAIDIAKGLHAKVVLLTTPPRRDPRPGAATDPH